MARMHVDITLAKNDLQNLKESQQIGSIENYLNSLDSISLVLDSLLKNRE